MDRTERKFLEFHAANPHVYEELRDLAFQAQAVGRKYWNINSLLHVLRWDWLMRGFENDHKLQNNYAPLYARLLMKQEPTLAGFFEFRGEDPVIH